MVSRLDLFRGYFQRLDPAATRVRTLRDELYIEPPGRAVGEQLATRLQLAPRSSHLIVGGVGTGKTTQVVRAAELLNATTDTRAVYVDVSRRHDLDKKLVGVLLVLAGLELAKLLRHHEDATVKAICEQFARWAYGHSEFVPWDPSDDDHPDYDHEHGDYVYRPGILARPLPPLPSGVSERIAALKTLTSALSPETEHFVIFFDSLDRLDDVEAFQRAAVEDVRALQQAEIGLAIVGPGRVLYGPNRPIVDIFDQLHSVPAVDVVSDGDGSARRFLDRVLAKRADDNVISPNARSALVHWSGGLLRDLLELTRSAVEEAFVAGADSVTDAHIASSVDAFGRTLMFGLRKNDLLTLQKLRLHKVFVPTTDDDLSLLVSRRVIEYPGITKRYSVHPTIEPLLASLGAGK